MPVTIDNPHSTWRYSHSDLGCVPWSKRGVVSRKPGVHCQDLNPSSATSKTVVLQSGPVSPPPPSSLNPRYTGDIH